MTLPLHSHVPISDPSGETSWGLRVRVGVGESESDEGESGSDEIPTFPVSTPSEIKRNEISDSIKSY